MKKIIYVLILIIITSLLGYHYKYNNDNDFDINENFENFSKTEFKDTTVDIYDKFYSDIYTELFNNQIKNEFELFNIINYTIKDKKIASFERKDVRFLDLGCGTGNHLKILEREKIKAVGIDKSIFMLEKARKNAPDTPLVKGDFMNKSTFKNREFTHIMCLFFSIYQTYEPDVLFKNINYWLKPKGYFCLHLVSPKKFDPILEKSSKLIPLYNPQKHADKRKTKTKLKFNKFKYVADWTFEKGNTQFIEHFMFNDNSLNRQNIHKLRMEPIKFYVDLANKNGMKLVKVIDLLPVNHDNSYIYIFQKKYGN